MHRLGDRIEAQRRPEVLAHITLDLRHRIGAALLPQPGKMCIRDSRGILEG